ncbi:uncharacterized protein LOC136753987 isoform X2 [Amia ocellicauda]|uniref:uncharacterized protein LOC136753987 isoform X2 n=1 Tax=Amia ocellicauda TaxID=2972642 RepID=UPI0034640B3A
MRDHSAQASSRRNSLHFNRRMTETSDTCLRFIQADESGVYFEVPDEEYEEDSLRHRHGDDKPVFIRSHEHQFLVVYPDGQIGCETRTTAQYTHDMTLTIKYYNASHPTKDDVRSVALEVQTGDRRQAIYCDVQGEMGIVGVQGTMPTSVKVDKDKRIFYMKNYKNVCSCTMESSEHKGWFLCLSKDESSNNESYKLTLKKKQRPTEIDESIMLTVEDAAVKKATFPVN